MKRYRLLLIILVLGIVIALLHALALEYFLYWQYGWFDILMHFLGGLIISLFALWGYLRFSDHGMSKGLLLFDVILFTFIICLFWESFELMFKLSVTDPVSYFIDTVGDFAMNTIGALVGYFLVVEQKLFRLTAEVDE